MGFFAFAAGISMTVFPFGSLHAQAPVCGPGDAPVVSFAQGLPGKQVRLSWAATPGHRYRVEKSPDLSPGSWKLLALVDAVQADATWSDPEAVSQRGFYRVTEPAAEVFSLTPPVLSPTGGILTVHGQCIPDGSLLVLEIEGMGEVSAPLVFVVAGQWAATLPPGSYPPGARVVSVRVVHGGATLATVDQQIEITTTGLAMDGPASMPPVAPVPVFASNPIPGIGIVVKRNPGSSAARGGLIVGQEECDDHNVSPGDGCDSLMGFWLTKKGYDYYQAKSNMASSGLQNNPLYQDKGSPVNPFAESTRLRPASSGLPGEVSFHVTALDPGTPAGPRLAMIHTYRSKPPVHDAAAPPSHWVGCYDISVEALPPTAGAAAPRVRIRDGGGRCDTFHRQSDGTYRCDGMFREGRFEADGRFVLTFADKGTWTFFPLNHAGSPGKIESITDRNDVSLTCAYDASGRLGTVSSEFGQSLVMSYDTSGRLDHVTDHGGRSVHYAYDSNGNLMSISAPTVSGAAPPSGPLSFTYQSGLAAPELNGNLLTITDGQGRLLEQFEYHSTTNPADVEFDTLASHNRHRTEFKGHVTLIKREALPPGAVPSRGYTVFEVDETGRLTESVCDALHRVCVVRQYTGFCTPGVPVTSTGNRPSGKLRPAGGGLAGDPDYFETRCDFNADHMCVRTTFPSGSQTLVTYERDLNPSCSVRERGNARVMSLRAATGETRTVTCEYQPGFGSPECARPGAPIKGISVKGGRNPSPDLNLEGRVVAGPGDVLDDDSDGDGVELLGRKGWDGLIYGPDRPRNKGKGTARIWSPRSNVDGGDDDCDGIVSYSARKGWDGKIKGSNLHEEGGRHTPFHNRMAPLHNGMEKGITINTSHVEYATGLIIGKEECDDKNTDPDDGCSARGGRKGWDGTVKGVSFVSRMITAHGQVFSWGYDANGNCTEALTPVPGCGSLFQYNTRGQCTSVTVTNGAGSSFRDEYGYDATSGFLTSVACDKPASGTGLAITTTVERDAYGRVTRLSDPEGAVWDYQYNALDRCVQVQSPGVPSRVTVSLTYDAGGRVVRCDTEHRGADGILDTSNPTYSTFYVYDERARLIRVAAEELAVDGTTATKPEDLGISNFSVCDITRDDAGQVVRLSTPAACRNQPSDRVCDFVYDERGLLFKTATGAAGTTVPVVVRCDYDADGFPLRRAIVDGEVDLAVETISYDGFHRPASVVDPMGNVTTLEYDNQGFVTTRVYGQLNDVDGDSGNQLLYSSRMRKRPEVLWSEVPGDFGAAKQPRCILKSFFQQGDKPAQARTVNVGMAFFCYMAEDDTVVTERFRPGNQGVINFETTVVDRSPAGLIQSVSLNGDLLFSCDYDSAGRLYRCSDGSCTASVTMDKRGGILVCGETDHFRIAGVPDKTFTKTYVRDALGRAVSCTDGVGNTVEFSFDSLSRLTRFAKPGRAPLFFAYDVPVSGSVASQVVLCDVAGTGSPQILGSTLVRCGEPVSHRDSYGHVTEWIRDAAGRAVRCNQPDGTHEEIVYDHRGDPVSRTFADGSVRNLTFDRLGRVLTSTWPVDPGITGPAATAYAHDGLGRCVLVSQDTSVVEMGYDSLGNPVSEVQAGVASAPVQVLRSFDHRGRTGVVYPGGKTFVESRDAQGRCLSVSELDGTGAVMTPPLVTLEYAGDRVWRSTRSNGAVTVHVYQGDGAAQGGGTEDRSFDACVGTMVTSVSGAVLSRSSVTRDPDQSVRIDETRYASGTTAPGRSKTFTLDSLGRPVGCVTRVRETSGGPVVITDTVTYELDLEGRRVSETRNGVTSAYSQLATSPPADRQMGQYSTWPGGSLDWDDNGNLLTFRKSADTLNFEYDLQGRMKRCTRPNVITGANDVVAEFSYDALGRVMIHKIHRGEELTSVEETRFVYDGGVCIQEINAAGAATAVFACADGEIQSLTTSGGSFVVHRGLSHWGDRATCPGGGRVWPQPGFSSTLVTNSLGTPVERQDCDDAFKPVFLDAGGLGTTHVGSSAGLRWLAPGCAWVPETGMVSCPGSLYSPDLGMTVCRDKDKPFFMPVDDVCASKHTKTGHVTLMK